MENEIQYNKVDWYRVFKAIWAHKKIYIISLPIAAILSSLYILCIPRTYKTDTEIILEVSNDITSSSSALGSLASSFGFNMSNLESPDAIPPMLYPDLMNDNGFVTDLFKIQVKTSDKKITCDYYTYLKKHQQYPWWTQIAGWIKTKFSSTKTSVPNTIDDPYNLPKPINDIVSKIRNDIKIKVDKKTSAITISTTDQDPLVCKIIADSTRNKLEKFITQYRTHKAENDCKYYEKLVSDAHKDYQKLRRLYAKYTDANEDVLLQSVKTKVEDIENDMQLKYNTYTSLCTQLDAARARLLANTPAFTMIKGAAVPIKPDGPKRMIFVLLCTTMTFIASSLYILKRIITDNGK